MIEIGTDTLDPYGGDTQVGDIVLRAAGVGGTVKVSTPSVGETRAETLGSDALANALDNQNVDTDYIIEISDTQEVDVGAGVSTRSTVAGHKGIEIEVPSAGEAYGQILLVTDENGLASWHLPKDVDGKLDTMRAGGTVTFLIPGYGAETAEEGKTRGALGFLGRKIVRALSFKLMDMAIGRVGEYFVTKWEQKNRPYRVREFNSMNYRDNTVAAITPAFWRKLGEGPALLFIHGTFSRASTAFYELPAELLDGLSDTYRGRVFAFDHPTLSANPTENAAFLVENMPDGISLDVDIVCHSRGGHVSRVLAENQNQLPIGNRSLKVRQVVFVACPNDGTILTEPKYMGHFIDSYTNILSVLPDNVITDTLEVIITVLKQMAVGVLKGLDGLQAMNPKSDYMKEVLNSGPALDIRYRAISADFEPGDLKFKPLAADLLMDKIFKEMNDLVVPTEGVYRGNGDPMFPIDEILQLDRQEGVHHGSYFSNIKVLKQLERWLTVS
jgi:pimeloyl-ACP methyl ester carboxylesterase